MLDKIFFLITFPVVSILCLAFCIETIRGQNNLRDGIMTVFFDSDALKTQRLLLPTSLGSYILSTIKAQSSSSAATLPVSNIQSAVTGAASHAVAIGTVIGAVTPKNCSLGIRYFCVGFSDHINCKALPLEVSSIMPTIIGQAIIETLDHALLDVTSGFEASLIASTIFTSVALISGILFVISLWKRQLAFYYHLCGWQISLLRTLCMLSTIACCISLAMPTFVLYKVLSTVQNLRVERGTLSSQLLGALSCAVVMGLATAVTAFLD